MPTGVEFSSPIVSCAAEFPCKCAVALFASRDDANKIRWSNEFIYSRTQSKINWLKWNLFRFFGDRKFIDLFFGAFSRSHSIWLAALYMLSSAALFCVPNSWATSTLETRLLNVPTTYYDGFLWARRNKVGVFAMAMRNNWSTFEIKCQMLPFAQQ